MSQCNIQKGDEVAAEVQTGPALLYVFAACLGSGGLLSLPSGPNFDKYLSG